MGIKKHYTQMTTLEKDTLANKISGIDIFTFTKYAKGRIAERNIDKSFIFDTIKNGKLIEYHYAGTNQHRILIRSVKPYYENTRPVSVCVVVDINTKEIITLYVNDFNDNHTTLNKFAYSRSINILKYLSA